MLEGQTDEVKQGIDKLQLCIDQSTEAKHELEAKERGGLIYISAGVFRHR